MTLEKISEYIKDIEAIAQYERVKQERDAAIIREKILGGELSRTKEELNNEIRTLTSQNQALNEAILDKEDEILALHKSLEDKDKEFARKNKVIEQAGIESANHKVRINELESLKVVAEGKTISEVEKAIIMAKDEEIDKRAQQKSLEIMQNWRTNDKQREVETEALLELDVIFGLLAGQARYLPSGLSGSNLPNMVNQAIRREVDSRQWLQWLKTNVEPKAKYLENKIEQNVFALLRGPWTIICDKCGAKGDFEFAQEHVEQLIGQRFIMVECPNPDCKGLVFRHQIRITLLDLINVYLHAPGK